MELTSDILKKEDALQKALNSGATSIDAKLIDVKHLLQGLAMAELVHQKFTAMLVTDENNNNKN